MIYIWNHDIARQRQQELLAAAERSRLARIARDQNAHGRTGYCKTRMWRSSHVQAELLAEATGVTEPNPRPGIQIRSPEPHVSVTRSSRAQYPQQFEVPEEAAIGEPG